MTVADLLTAARQAHTQYRQAAGRIDAKGTISQPNNQRAGGEHVRAALLARLDAEQLDPLHDDRDAWSADAVAMRTTSDALISFYSSYLAPVQSMNTP